MFIMFVVPWLLFLDMWTLKCTIIVVDENCNMWPNGRVSNLVELMLVELLQSLLLLRFGPALSWIGFRTCEAAQFMPK